MKITKFYLLLLFGLTIFWGVSSSSWFSMWMALEMNGMMFIPLMWLHSTQHHIESIMKYFLIQSVSSMTLIGLSGSMNLPIFLCYTNLVYMMLFFTLLLKIGMFPFLFWYIEVINKCTFLSMLMIMTIQKLLPVIMISFIMDQLSNVMFVLICINALVGALMGLNQTVIKKIIGYSSVSHMSWLIVSVLKGCSIFIIYFSVYSMILLCLVMFIERSILKNFMELLMLKDSLFSMNILSLAGVPPFSGFIMKWVVIDSLLSMNLILVSIILILSSLISLYFYLRMMMIVPMNFLVKMKSQVSGFYFSFLMILNLMLFPLLIVIYL
uniref:NADH-ubiquinone oxidoreductase chain 2 n=1 Tax=Rhynchothorax sp. JZ-2022 TaxID=2992009 RepID=A0A9E7V7E4_9CHEL|nr:NADH dehydrogenase subunit 2 [Rhynchothorax sp. JZ-2022]